MVKARRRAGLAAEQRDRPPRPPRACAPADLYRRQARRLRGRFYGQPARLQQSLRVLARDYDAQRGIGSQQSMAEVRDPVPAVFAVPQDAADKFTAMVRDRLEGQILRFDERQFLLGAAGRMGIDRFRANLIIAAVQHAQARGAGEEVATRSTGAGWGVPLALFLLVQAVIAFALWRLIAG